MDSGESYAQHGEGFLLLSVEQAGQSNTAMGLIECDKPRQLGRLRCRFTARRSGYIIRDMFQFHLDPDGDKMLTEC